jgi:predicted ATP-dependent Lon-type protease
MESVDNSNKRESFQKNTQFKVGCGNSGCNDCCDPSLYYIGEQPPINASQPESYEETFQYSVRVTTEDIIDRLYVVAESMPDKTFIDIFHNIFGGCRTPVNNVETMKMITAFIKANHINADIDTPNEKLDTLSYRLIDDLDVIETNVSYCLRNKRYLEAEKEISCHKTISGILNELLPEDKNDAPENSTVISQ